MTEGHATGTLWDPEVLGRIARLHLVANKVVDGLLHGVHRSRRTGPNVEFADYKEYAAGDDLRHLDWRVLARSDRHVIRRYEAETELACYLVVDVSGDLGTGAGGRYQRPPLEGSKFAYAVTLAATLATFLQRHQERVGLALMGGEGAPWRFVPARGGRSHLAQLFGVLASVRPAGVADLGTALSELAPRLPRRALVVLVSDLMEDAAAWAPALQGLARRRTDLVAFHLLDRRELSMDYAEPLVFYSPEGGDALPLDPAGIRDEFVRVVEGWQRECRAALEGAGGRYLPVWTEGEMDRVLRRALRGLR